MESVSHGAGHEPAGSPPPTGSPAGAGAQPPPPTGPPSGTGTASTSPPPGWWWDGAVTRWWDGHRWTEHVAPPQPTGPNSDDKTLAMIAHAGLLAGGFVLPLIMYLISNDDDRPETRHHAREALNFQLTFLAVYLGAMFVMFATMFAGVVSSAPSPGDDFPLFPFAGMFLGFIGLFALFAVNIVFSVMGAVRANRGERWQYPVRIPFVRG